MEGTGEELGRGRLLDHLAGVHHGDLVGQLRDQGQVVGDEEDGQVLLSRSSWSSSTIWAWMVTSSAVVGSSAMSRRG